jgi:D-alanyl-D-alanine dipeptidase
MFRSSSELMISSRKLPRSRWPHFASVLGTFISVFAGKLAANPDLVEIKSVAPSIVIELRYATPHNVTGRPLYPRGLRAMVLPSVAQQLADAQKFLCQYGYGLKIWDAYRPKQAQVLLWQLAGKGDYIADPENGFGSMHSWGVSVDATLVDAGGHSVKMPTDFDEFTPAAAMYYQGIDPLVRAHLRLLQVAMAVNDFYGFRIEWWHFTTADWKKYVPYQEAKQSADSRNAKTEKLKAASQKDPNSKT